MRQSPGCNCCGGPPPVTCGQVCVITQSSCSSGLAPGVPVTVQLIVVGSITPGAGGSGYTNGTNKALGFTGGTGTGAAGLFDVVGGSVTNIRLTAGGSGYVTAPAINFTAGGIGGSGATATANLSTSTIGTCTTSGAVTSISVGNPTTNGPYTTQPNVTISGDGSGATATAVRTGGLIATPSVTASGTGYTTIPTVTISETSGFGSGAVLNVRMGVESVSINAGGTGYAVGNVLTLSTAGIIQAQLTVTSVSSGVITGVSVTNAGSYTALPVSPVNVTGGTGSGAKFNLLTWKLVSLTVSTSGSLYVSPTIGFTGGGGGSGAAATTTASTIRVNSVTITSFGTSYTAATVAIDPPAAGTTATATATVKAQCCVAVPADATYRASVASDADFTITATSAANVTTTSCGTGTTTFTLNPTTKTLTVTVTGCSSLALAGATVTLSGGASGTATTNSSGLATLTGVPSNTSITVTASKSRFTSSSTTFTTNFCAESKTLALSADGSDMCLSSCNGDAVPNNLILTDANGTHTMTGSTLQYTFFYSGNSYPSALSSCTSAPSTGCSIIINYQLGGCTVDGSGNTVLNLTVSVRACVASSFPAGPVWGTLVSGVQTPCLCDGTPTGGSLSGVGQTNPTSAIIPSPFLPFNITFTVPSPMLPALVGSTVTISE